MRFDDIAYDLIDVSKKVVVFGSKKVITMDKTRPYAEAVGVQNGIIVAIGKKDSVIRGLKVRNISFEIDDRFEKGYLYPGFSEHHMHPHIMGAFMEGSNYIGFTDRTAADGNILPGIKTVQKLKERIKELVKINQQRLSRSDKEWLNCWGYDPLMLGDADVGRDILDEVCKDNPLCINHASGHLMSLNSKAIELSGYDKLPVNPNLPRYEDGRLNGTIEEPEMMHYAFKAGASQLDYSVQGLVRASEVSTRIARLKGCTSITDKGTNFPLTPKDMASKAWLAAREQNKLFTRVNMEVWFSTIDVWEYDGKKGWEAIKELQKNKDNMLRVGNLKILTDGSIQGFTANLLPNCCYIKPGKENGLLQVDIDHIEKYVRLAESAGMSVSIHTNGNGATEASIQAIERVRKDSPSIGYRHSLEHCQLATENQFWRMAKLGIEANLFANHIYYWGDAHAAYTVGEHGVRHMDACASALRYGLKIGLHSDDMVTEVSPLFAAWCATNRKSLSGKVYGEDQCISVDEAMRIITYNHAYLAHQENVRGSIELGKWADFTILEEEAIEENKERLKDLKIIGTVIGGNDIFMN
ncbi:amidohydrolase [Helicobacter sp. 13S00477-4]|uniref:amidohydrolase n=1 Tax=Helicobacter sp. 13S00477-4 TaxID=1905759 RepID=UPI000BA51158|nr:amidohydrolase [Helicobacter sp. 13S00477-4]PAF52242.1 amidohydrolase [Helicobacter sp. 13S00477-4]